MDVESHTHTEECFVFLFLAPYARTTRHEEAFTSLKKQEKKARFARAPHDKKKRPPRKKSEPIRAPYDRIYQAKACFV